MSSALKALGLAAAVVSLSACASSNFEKEWNCGVVDGVGCRTISEIQSTIVRTGEAPSASYVGVTQAPGVDLEYQGVPMWKSDQIMKIYVGDFIDDRYNYHSESVIYTVIREAGWAVK